MLAVKAFDFVIPENVLDLRRVDLLWNEITYERRSINDVKR